MNRNTAFGLAGLAGLIGLAPSVFVDLKHTKASAQSPSAGAEQKVPLRDFKAADAAAASSGSARNSFQMAQGFAVPTGASLRPDAPPLPTAPASSVAPARTPKMKMGEVERIRLRAWGNPEANGEYSIDPDYSLSVPGLKRLSVGEMTPAQLEAELSTQMSEALHRDIKVSVEVQRTRPFFIMGLVGQAGAFEWHPGLNVIRAVSLAGGIVKSSDRASDYAVTVTAGGSRLGALKARLVSLNAQKDALLDGSKIGSADAAAGGGRSDGADVMASVVTPDEQEMLSAKRLMTAESERRSAQLELEAVSQQVNIIKNQLALAQGSARDLEDLKRKKLISNRAYFVQQSELVGMDGKLGELLVAMQRAKLRNDAAVAELSSIKQERQAQLNRQIESLNDDIAAQQASGDTTSTEVRPALQYFIAHTTDNKIVTERASVFSDVMPGDVVIIAQRGRIDSIPNATSSAELAQWVLEASSKTATPTVTQAVQPQR